MNAARFLEGAVIALDSVRTNKVRAGLTILGVAIGVMVVISMAAVITGINRSVSKIIEQAGPKTFFVFRYFREGVEVEESGSEAPWWQRNPRLTIADADVIRRLPTVKDVMVREDATGKVSFETTTLEDVPFLGLSGSWMDVTGGELLAGRNFSHVEYAASSRVVVLNRKSRETLFGGRDPIGATIRINGQPFVVVGVYQDPSAAFGSAGPPVLFMPHTAFVKVAEFSRGWMRIGVIPTEAATMGEAMDQVTVAMRTARGLKPTQRNNFSLIAGDKLIDVFNSVTAGFFGVMLALSSVGLLVGGIGVVAIMMISVTERTREIGVRKALGATRREIMFQFLVEAATLTLLGGLVGMAMGWIIAFAVDRFTPLPASIPLWSIVTAIVASTVTGIFFGLYPASRASKLDPVEALRFE